MKNKHKFYGNINLVEKKGRIMLGLGELPSNHIPDGINHCVVKCSPSTKCPCRRNNKKLKDPSINLIDYNNL